MNIVQYALVITLLVLLALVICVITILVIRCWRSKSSYVLSDAISETKRHVQREFYV